MARERGELVPIGEVVPGLDDVPAIRDGSPQARRSFTVADQVEQLVTASEADPDRGFMARTMALCSLPRSNPGNRTQYKRANGPYTLVMSVAGINKLPFGNLPRLILAWICTEVVKTRSREVVLGKSLADFMRSLDVYSSSGGKYTRLRNQMKRLFGCSVSMTYKDEHGEVAVNSLIADRTAFWWNERKPDEPMLWDSKIYLGEAFFNEIIRHPVPLDMNTLTALKRSSAGPRSLLVAHLPHFHAPRSAAPLLAADLPAVRSESGQSQRQPYCSEFSPRLPTRAHQDQVGLAGVELHHGSGRPDPLALAPGHRSVIRPASARGIDPRGLEQEGRDEIEDIHLGLPKSD